MPSKISAIFSNLLWKLWYPFLTRLSTNSPVTFLNYGYADPTTPPNLPPLNPTDEPNRPCIQLYHRVVTPLNLRNLDLLEVSCGHGGGAAYLAHYHHPRSLTAIDRNPRAIQLCKKQHHHPNLTFSLGNALALHFPPNSFDALINIEASHCYPDLPRFLSQVQKVLRPNGHFLYADFRQTHPQADLLHHQLQSANFQILSRTDITQNVLRGMQLNTPKYTALIHQLVPKFLQKSALNFAGIKGSPIYNQLDSGKTVYLSYHLRK